MANAARDVFVSHASEDKEAVVIPLVRALRRFRITTWYDGHELKVGDSLREKIDAGLTAATHGIVVLSPNFFAKRWPKEELDGMFSRRTVDGRFSILPVWHNVSVDDVAAYSPMLAGKVGVSTDLGINTVADQLRRALRPVNELDPQSFPHIHTNETIRITDLPLAFGWVEGRYFEKCHFLGPAVIGMDSCTMYRSTWASRDSLFPLKGNRSYPGIIGFRDCAIVDSIFADNVGFGVPEASYEEILATGFSQASDV